MRVIDYQVLFRKQVQSIHNLDELSALLELKNSLEALGVLIDKQTALEAIQSLAVDYAKKQSFTSLNQLLALLKQYLPADFGDVWKTTDYLLRLTDAHQSPLFTELLTRVLSADWAGALWLLEAIREKTNNPVRLNALQSQMRKAANISSAYASPITTLIPLMRCISNLFTGILLRMQM